MKVNKLKLWSVFGLSVGVLSVQTLSAVEATKTDSVKVALTSVSSLDLPSKTASLIAAAPAQGKCCFAKSTIQAAIKINPTAAPAIVGAVAATTPDFAMLAAATAVELQPSQATLITKAAVAACPAKAADIVTACCEKAPAQYAGIAIAAAKAAPSAKSEILTAASKAAPAPVRANVEVTGAAAALPASVVLNRAILASEPSSAKQGFGYFAGAPVSGPEISHPNAPAPLTIADTIIEPVGPRNYSRAK